MLYVAIYLVSIVVCVLIGKLAHEADDVGKKFLLFVSPVPAINTVVGTASIILLILLVATLGIHTIHEKLIKLSHKWFESKNPFSRFWNKFKRWYGVDYNLNMEASEPIRPYSSTSSDVRGVQQYGTYDLRTSLAISNDLYNRWAEHERAYLDSERIYAEAGQKRNQSIQTAPGRVNRTWSPKIDSNRLGAIKVKKIKG